MRVTPKRLVLFCSMALLSAFSGCACSFLVTTHLRKSPSMEVRKQYVKQPGDASPEVRAGALLALNKLQEGYARRDVNDLGAFMYSLFARDGDILILGADGGEWIHGYANAAEFIRGDWLKWGSLSLSVGDSIVCSSGDVAWTATIGEVRWKNAHRPLRLSAILVRKGDQWVFRQMVFQWDDSEPRFRDLLQPQVVPLLVSRILERIAPGNPGSTGY